MLSKKILAVFAVLATLAGCASTGNIPAVVAPSGLVWELTTYVGDLMMRRQSHQCQPTAGALEVETAARLIKNPLLIDPGVHCVAGSHRLGNVVYMPTTTRELLPGVTTAAVQVYGGREIAKVAGDCRGPGCGNGTAPSASSSATVNLHLNCGPNGTCGN